MGDAFLDGLRLCLIVAAALALLAALVSAVLLRRPRREFTAPATVATAATRPTSDGTSAGGALNDGTPADVVTAAPVGGRSQV